MAIAAPVSDSAGPPERDPAVSVVVPTKNRHDSLDRTLTSVAAQDFRDLEVIVVDDGSEPPVSVSASAKVVRNARSMGASAAKNLGMEAARGEFVLFLDDDVELVGVDLISRAVSLVRRHPSCAIVGFRQLDPVGIPRGEQPARADRPCVAGRFFSYGCLARRAPLVEAGGFETLFGYYYEENELGLRLLDEGRVLLYDPTLEVVHHYDDRGRDWQRIHRLLLRNTGYAAILRYPAWCILLVLPNYVKVYFANSFGHGRVRCIRDFARTVGEWACALPELLRRRRPVRYATLRRMKRLNQSPEAIEGADRGVDPDGRLDGRGEMRSP